MTTPAVPRAVDAAFREERATLIRRVGDRDLAEVCAQEAFTQALRRCQDRAERLVLAAAGHAEDRARRPHRGWNPRR
jgi:predicted RNA polymerase sigma factor